MPLGASIEIADGWDSMALGEDDVHLTRAAEMMDVHPPKNVIYPLVN